MSSILWVPNLVQRQIGRDDQRLSTAVATVYNVVDLFQRILRAALHSKVVDNKQRVSAQPVYYLVPPGETIIQFIQDLRKVCHAHGYFLLHQSVCNAPGKETLAGAHTARPREEVLGSLYAWSAIALHSGVHGASVGCGHCRFQRSSPALTGQKIPLLSAAAQGRCAFAG